MLEWAPDIPPAWDVVNLKMLARIFAGGTPDRKNADYWSDGTVPWLNSGSVNDWAISKPSELIAREALANGATRWAPKGSVLVALAGQGKTKGMAARLEINSTLNQSLAAIAPGASLDYRFLQYWLASNYLNIRGLAGGDLRDGLNLQHIGSIQVPRPPVEEQRAIADYLDRETAQIDAFIAKNEKLIALLTERRAAVIARAVTRGLDENAEMKESGVATLGIIPAHWTVNRIRNVGRAIIGLTYSPEDICDEDDAGTLVLRAGNIQNGELVFKDCVYVGKAIPKALRLRLGDIVICARNGSARLIGKNAVATSEVVGHTWGAFMVVLRTPINEYLSWVLNSAIFTSSIGAFATSTINQLTSSTLHSLQFAMPPKGEQAAISAYLTEVTAATDSAAHAARRAVDLARERRAALISAAVTGKMEIGAAA